MRCAALGMVVLIAGCSSLPASGPSKNAVLEQFTPAQNPTGARLVTLDPAVVGRLHGRAERSLHVIDQLRSNRATDRLGPGDVLAISIYETGDGLFTSHHAADATTGASVNASSTAETLPRLTVDRAGSINVPYAGAIRVAGRTTAQVQSLIESRLAGKTAQAQVVVSLASNESNVVYVSGDVHMPGRYALPLGQLELLDLVALAGGPTHSPQDTLVKVTRDGSSAVTSLRRVQAVSAENIPVQPQDRVEVDYLPRSYVSLGATGRMAELPFDAPNVTLAEAIARVGGLDDQRANPEAVFLFRFETALNASAVLGTPTPDATADPAPVPIVYQANMRDPQTLFTMQQFDVHDKDVIYVANAPTAQIYKFLQLIYTLASPAIIIRAVAN